MNDFAAALLADEEFARRVSELRKIRHRIPELERLAPIDVRWARKARLLKIEEAQLARDLEALAGRIQRRLYRGDN